MFQATPLNCSHPRSCVTKININKYMCLRQSSLFIFVVFYREKKEKFEDTKGRYPEAVIRRTYNTMVKGTNNDLQNITQKTKDRATRAPLKTGLNCPFSFALSVLRLTASEGG
jgi:hypothetical protein